MVAQTLKVDLEKRRWDILVSKSSIGEGRGVPSTGPSLLDETASNGGICKSIFSVKIKVGMEY